MNQNLLGKIYNLDMISLREAIYQCKRCGRSVSREGYELHNPTSALLSRCYTCLLLPPNILMATHYHHFFSQFQLFFSPLVEDVVIIVVDVVDSFFEYIFLQEGFE